MTSLQLEMNKLNEQKRSNISKEKETHRSNLKNEELIPYKKAESVTKSISNVAKAGKDATQAVQNVAGGISKFGDIKRTKYDNARRVGKNWNWRY